MKNSSTLGRVIEDWSTRRSANVSLESYKVEISIWRDLVNTDGVDTVLDIGGGVGLFSAMLLKFEIVSTVIVLDPHIENEGTSSEEFDRTAPILDELYGDDLRFVKGAFPADLPDDTVDLILFRQSLHHIYESHSTQNEEVIEGLQTASNHLSDDGWIYILEPAIPAIWMRAAIRTKRRLNNVGTIDWNGKRNGSEWTTLLSDAGFKNIKKTSIPFNITCGYPFIERVAQFLSHRTLITAQPSN